MNSNFINTNDPNLYQRGVNRNLRGMNTQFTNMDSNMDTNNLLTEQTFQKYDIIPKSKLETRYINNPYKLVLYKSVPASPAITSIVFELNEPLKDVVSVKLVNCLSLITSAAPNYPFLLLNIDELSKNKSSTSNIEFNGSFATIDYDSDLNSKNMYKNNGIYNDIKYFDPPLNSLNRLTCFLFGNGATALTTNFDIKLELLVETKEKLRVY
tara:strand:- start:5538 stop:6170 length:633 start_codon:yes stop_codon:yes gene_type:complete